VRYLGMEVDRAIEVAEQIDISIADAIAAAADMVGAGDFAADLGAAEDRFCRPTMGRSRRAPSPLDPSSHLSAAVTRSMLCAIGEVSRYHCRLWIPRRRRGLRKLSLIVRMA
jgi:hypothetical protein